jgi:hypothetical protein
LGLLLLCWSVLQLWKALRLLWCLRWQLPAGLLLLCCLVVEVLLLLCSEARQEQLHQRLMRLPAWIGPLLSQLGQRLLQLQLRLLQLPAGLTRQQHHPLQEGPGPAAASGGSQDPGCVLGVLSQVPVTLEGPLLCRCEHQHEHPQPQQAP